MADKINYGESEAVKAQRAVEAYTQGAQNSLATVKSEIDKVAAELAAGIQVGMTPEETAAMNARLNNLKNQAQTITGQIQASYDFATKQSQTSQQEYNQQILAMQEAQRRATASALGQLQAVPLPGGYSSTVASDAESIRRQAAAEQAYMTGRESVPAEIRTNIPGLLPTTPATAGGVVGVTGGTQKLFETALSSAQQSALAQLKTRQLELTTALEEEARKEAAQRQAQQQKRYDDFKLSAFDYITKLTTDIGTKRAELLASAAAADTRNGKQIALAELDKYDRQQAIQYKYDLGRIKAQSRVAGASSADLRELEKALTIQKGAATTNIGNILQNRLTSIGSTVKINPNTNKLDPINGTILAGAGNKPFTTNGKDRFELLNGVLFYTPNKDAKQKETLQIDILDFQNRVYGGIGFASTIQNKKERDKQLQVWFNDKDNGLGDLLTRNVASLLLGSDATKLNYWLSSFDNKNTFTKIAQQSLATNLLPAINQQTTKPKVPTPSPQISPVPRTGFINPTAPILNVSNAFSLIEAAKNAEAGKIQSRMYYAPNNVVYNVFTYKGKTYYSPKGSTAEIYTKDSNDRFKRVYA
jgi:hypothetical protein